MKNKTNTLLPLTSKYIGDSTCPVPLNCFIWCGLALLGAFSISIEFASWYWVSWTKHGVGALLDQSALFSGALKWPVPLQNAFAIWFGHTAMGFWGKPPRFSRREGHRDPSCPSTHRVEKLAKPAGTRPTKGSQERLIIPVTSQAVKEQVFQLSRAIEMPRQLRCAFHVEVPEGVLFPRLHLKLSHCQESRKRRSIIHIAPNQPPARCNCSQA